MNSKELASRLVGLFAGALTAGCLALAASADETAGAQAAPEAAQEARAETPPGLSGAENRVTRQGLTVEFGAHPVLGSFEDKRGLVELDQALVSFNITDAVNGEPVRGLLPGAWIDLVETAEGGQSGAMGCGERVGIYLRGSTGIQPMIDLNSYFVLVMNEDATISVIDPTVLVSGVANMLFTQVILPRPGGDWVQTADQQRIFVTMPRADTLGVIDTGSFKLVNQVKTGREPLRVALQPDERYVWVGDNAEGGEAGVTVIDAKTLDVAAHLATGAGHHELAFSADSRIVLVTNRQDGTATAIDTGALKVFKQIPAGRTPVSVVYSSQSKAFYVADGEEGVIRVIDGLTLDTVARVETKPGAGPMRVSDDGRWVFVTNAANDMVYVVDASSNAVAHEIPIEGRPYQVSFTYAFAYIRALDSSRVSMVELAKLGRPEKPPVVSFPLGETPPSKAQSLSIADGIAGAAGDAGVVVVDPATNSLYYYMEGMNAPTGSFRSSGYNPRAVLITDRFLDEGAPGLYSARFQVPRAGRYEVAFLLDAPSILHCFQFEAKENPALKRDLKPLAIEYLNEERTMPAGEPYRLRFRLTDPASEGPKTGLSDVAVLSYRSPGADRRVVAAKEVEEGVYEAELAIGRRGAYFVYVGSDSSQAPFGVLSYMTLRVLAEGEPMRPVERTARSKEAATTGKD